MSAERLDKLVEPRLRDVLATAHHQGRLNPPAAETALLANSVDLADVSRLDVSRWLKHHAERLFPKQGDPDA